VLGNLEDDASIDDCIDTQFEHSWTEQRLQTLYRRYNWRYWNGELPPVTIEIEKCLV